MAFLIVGLGNPGSRYSHTPHNLGFDVVDQLVARWSLPAPVKKFQSEWWDSNHTYLMKPQTFMNNSGNAVREAATFFRLESHQVVVISDDLDMPPGALRIRKKGGAGGHNGLKSIISAIGEDFPRVRIGIGRSETIPSDEFILVKIPKAKRTVFDEAVLRAADAIETLIKEGVDKAMNTFNQKGPDVA